jgi:branched-chain amino acid transport system ATP-binding protein
MNREILSVQKLTVKFGGLTAVNEVDLSIRRNEIASLIGPNGAGKTTLFNAITGFVRKSSGSVLFEGTEVGHLKPHQIAEKGIVRTFQITSVFPNLSVLDNIRTAYHREGRERLLDVLFHTRRKQALEKKTLDRALEVLDFVGLSGKKDSIASNLPYGEQRVLEIAIALAAGPTLILLDEPSAGLNDTETLVMKNLIGRIREQGITILLVEHDMKLVMGISDRIVVVNFGRRIAGGTPDEIRRNPEVIRAYLGEAKTHARG